MKILFTGFTARFVGSTKVRHEMVATSWIVPHCLRLLGHQVDQRVVRYGEDVSDYDAVIVGGARMLSTTIRMDGVIGSCWAISQKPDSKVLWVYDDWKAMEMAPAAAGWLRDVPGRLRFLTGDKVKESDDCMKPVITVLDSMAERTVKDTITGQVFASTDDSPWACALNVSAWADADKILKIFPKMRETYFYDPTPVCPIDWGKYDRERLDVLPRKHEWTLATLQDHMPWVRRQKFEWPVNVIGYEKGNKGRGVVNEDVVRALYPRSWGILAPEYPIPGWWRIRFYHSAEAGCILYCGQSDAELMHESFQHATKFIEETGVASQVLLSGIAAQQRDFIRRNTWTKEQLLTRWSTIAKDLTA